MGIEGRDGIDGMEGIDGIEGTAPDFIACGAHWPEIETNFAWSAGSIWVGCPSFMAFSVLAERLS